MFDPTLDDEQEVEKTIHDTDIDEVDRGFFGDYEDEDESLL